GSGSSTWRTASARSSGKAISTRCGSARRPMGPLVDTSVIVDAYRGAKSAQVEALRRCLLRGPAPATTPIVLQEVFQGARDGQLPDRIARHLSGFEPLDVPSYSLHERAADIFRRAQRAGVTASTVDVLIVAVAAANGRRLLTADVTQ